MSKKINSDLPIAIRYLKHQLKLANMLNVAPGTKTADAYDALIFLAPLDKLHFSAQVNYIYTQQFKPELERRLRLLKGNDFDRFLIENNSATFEEFLIAIQNMSQLHKILFLKNKGHISCIHCLDLSEKLKQRIKSYKNHLSDKSNKLCSIQ